MKGLCVSGCTGISIGIMTGLVSVFANSVFGVKHITIVKHSDITIYFFIDIKE